MAKATRFWSLETSADALLLNELGTVVDATLSVTIALGYDMGALVGLDVCDLIAEPQRKAVRECISAKIPLSLGLQLRRKDNAELTREVSVKWRERQGEHVALLSVNKDPAQNSDRAQIARLEEQVRAFHIIMEHVSQGITYLGENLDMVVCNDQFVELTGTSPDLRHPGTPFAAYMRYNAEHGEYGPGDIEELVQERVDLAMKKQAHCFERERPDGSVIEVRGVPLENGGFVSTYTDVTARKQNEKLLQQAHDQLEQRVEERTAELRGREKELAEKSALLEATLEHMGQGITMLDKHLNLVVSNTKFLEMLDLPESIGAIGTSLEFMIRFNAERGEYGEGDTEELVRDRIELANKSVHHCFERRRPDGRVLEISGAPLDGGGFVTTYTDVTARKKAEQLLKEAHAELEERVKERTAKLKQREHELAVKSELLEMTVENMTQGISVYNASLGLLLCNRRFLELLDFPSEFGKPGTPLKDFFTYNAERGEYGEGDIDKLVAERMALAENPVPHLFQRTRLDGIVIEVRGNPLPMGSGAFLTTYTDISPLVRAQQELSLAKDEADKANEAKSDFLAKMSHELRTPLNAIIGLTEMLEEDAAESGDNDYLEPLGRVHRAGCHLLELINDILDLSKIEAGKMSLNLEWVEVCTMVDEVYSTCMPLAEKNGNELVVQCAIGVGSIYTDQLRLRQVIFNLISNACKFTNNGEVSLRIERQTRGDQQELVIIVNDNGIGLSTKQVNSIFDEFIQADANTASHFGGTGLGLAISRKICQLLGGEIAVESSLGHGAEFSVRLPMLKPETSAFVS